MRKLIFFIPFCILLTSQLFAQRKLIIAKRVHPAKYEFYEGEEIRFKLKGEDYWTKALIQGMGEGYLRLHYARIPIEDIEMIDVRNKKQSSFLMTTTSILFIGAVAFPAMEFLNGTVRNGEPFDTKSLNVAGYMAAGGLLLFLTKRRKVKIGKKFFLRVAEY